MKVTMRQIFSIFLGPSHARVCLFSLGCHYQLLFCYHDPGRGDRVGRREKKKVGPKDICTSKFTAAVSTLAKGGSHPSVH